MTELIRCLFDLTLEVDGVRYDVSQFSATYGRNEIPSARVVLAVGRLARDGKTPAKVHTTTSNFKKMKNAKVYFSATGEYSPGLEWPSGEHIVFEGRISGIGFTKVSGKLHYVVHIRHWLVDLAFSSSLSSQSHPSNVTDYTFASTVSPLIQLGTAGGGVYSIGQTAEGRSITMDTVTDDLWGRALKPLLCGLAKEDHILLSTELQVCVGADGKNDYALAALKRMEGVAEGDDCSLELSCYTPKLSLNAELDEASSAAGDAIMQAIRRQSIESFAHATLWDKLVGSYSPLFMFAVVPQAEKALVVPFTPGLRQTYCKEITANDYDYIDLPARLERPTRAVAVYCGKEMDTGIAEGVSLGVGGCFAPEGVGEDGMIYFIGGPAWLTNVLSSGTSVSKTTGVKGEKAASSATTPIEPDDELKADKKGASRAEIARDIKDMYDDYAHAVYIHHALRGRMGRLSGKLRFDIAPGSTVKIEGTSEQFLVEDDLAQNMVADVVRVTIGINAEQAKAGTAFQFANVRTEEENESDLTSVDIHPLYTTKFMGAPLVPALGFAKEGENCCF